MSEANSRKKLNIVFQDFSHQNARYVMERRKWIDRLMHNVQKKYPEIIWDVISMNDYSDLLYLNILRFVRAMHIKIKAFSRDVDATALSHSKGPGIDLMSKRRLSVGYILEEIAMSIRIRASNVINAEYYMGSLPLALLNIYTGKYGIDVSTFSRGLVANKKANFYEVEFRGTAIRWTRV